MPKNFGIIIQARMGSSRLPEKILMPLGVQDESVIQIVVSKLKSLFPEVPITIATSSSRENDVLETWCKDNQVSCLRGSEDDVLSRFISVAEKNSHQTILRICSDNPFLYNDSLKLLCDKWKDGYSYLSFRTNKGIPAMKTHFGFFAEIVSTEALRKVVKYTDDIFYREHVTNFVYENDKLFDVQWLAMPDKVRDRNDVRLTMDTKADYLIARDLFRELNISGPFYNFNLNNLLKTLGRNSLIKKMKLEIENNIK